MRFPLALVTFLLTFAIAAPAFATTVVFPDGTPAQPYQTWVNSSLVPGPPGTVVVNLAGCPTGAAPEWAAACAMPSEHEIYLGPDGRTKAAFFHELGHVFDASVMTDPLRQSFALLVRRPGVWGTVATVSDPPSEQFAEAYSMCARHRRIRSVAYGMYSYTPTPAQHLRACALIRQA